MGIDYKNTIMDIYKITNKVNNKVYIGLTTRNTNSRWISHKSRSKTAERGIDAALRKYGIENFEVETIETNIESLDKLAYLEGYYIEVYDSSNPEKGYNIIPAGGFGTLGYKHSEEDKIRCGSSFRGKHREKTPDQVDKWRKTCLANNSLKKSDETKQKHSKSLKLAYLQGRRVPNGKGIGGRGPMSDEEKLINSESQKGKRDMHHTGYGINLVAYKDEIKTLLDNGWEFKKIPNYYNMSRKEAKEKKII